MIWISIILGLIEALPGIVKLLQEIWGAIHTRAGSWHAFTGLLLKHQAVNGTSSDAEKAAAHADLLAFHAKHVTAVAP